MSGFYIKKTFMKNGFSFLLIIACLSSCATMMELSRPKGFTYKYDAKYTGIDTLLNVDGYFFGSNRHALYIYRDGTMANYETWKPTSFDTKDKFFPQWGVYRVMSDTIKAQTIVNLGGSGPMRTGMYTYIIRSKDEVELFSEAFYVNNPESLKKNLKVDTLSIPLKFTSYPNRTDSAHWVKKHKWFWDKEARKNRNK